MQLALNKYTIMRKNSEWEASTEQNEQLTALSAEISKKMEALSNITKIINKKDKGDNSNQDRNNMNSYSNNSSKNRKAEREAKYVWK